MFTTAILSPKQAEFKQWQLVQETFHNWYR